MLFVGVAIDSVRTTREMAGVTRDARWIDLAGSLRMQAQRALALRMQAVALVAGDVTEERLRLGETEAALDVLRNGDEGLGVSAAESDEVLASLASVVDSWQALRPVLMQELVVGEQQIIQVSSAIIVAVEEYVELVNDLLDVRTIQQDAASRSFLLGRLLLGAGGMLFLLFFLWNAPKLRKKEQVAGDAALLGARLEQIMASTADGIITIDRKGIVQSFNKACERTFGYLATEVTGQNINMLMPPPYQEEHDGYLSRYQRTGEAHIIGKEREVEGRRKDGSTFPLALRVSEMEIPDGETMYIGMIQDITEREKAEEALRRSEAEYRGLVDEAMYGIYRSATDGTLLMANPALVEMLGYDSEAELLALGSIEKLYADPEQRPDKVKEFEEKQEAEVEWKQKDGTTLLVRLRGKLVGDGRERGGVFQVMAEDVTERRILEERLRQGQRLEALGQLAGGVAHDFNNILSVIIVEAQLGMRRLGDDDPVRKRLSDIKAAGDRAADVTRQLLAFSRKQLVEPVVLSLNGMVSDLESMLTRLIAEDIDFTIALDETPVNVLADRGQLEQILTNLVVNARDAMPRGGELTIRTSMMTPDQAFLRAHPGLTSRLHAVLEVQDAGRGIPKDVQARMFDPFFTTKGRGKGTGLGLATVYGILQKMDGHIDVESELEVGTTMRVYLPIVDEAQTEVRSTEDSTLPSGTETVLVVEDDLGLRQVTVRLLEEYGYTVMSAEDGSQALQQLGAYEGDVHLLLTDVVLPGMGGRELAEQFLEIRPEAKVLYMSGYMDDKIFQQRLVTHKISFLPKPFTAESLTAAVRRVLDRE